MELVRLKEKGQFTLPASIREKILAQTGDLFLFTVEGNRVVMEPQEVSSRARSAAPLGKKGVDIGPWIGAAKGAFANVAEADEFVRAERGQWE